MATKITATNCTRYNNGTSYSDESPLAGIHPTGNAIRVVRYTFSVPADGASSFTVLISGCSVHNGTPSLRFYVTTSSSSHIKAAGTSFAYDGTLTRRATTTGKGQYEYYSGTILKPLLPNTTYYLWVFAGTTSVGTAFMPCTGYQYTTDLCSITIDKVAGIVYIGNEPYQCYIGNGSAWEPYIPYIGAGGTTWTKYGK